MSNIKLQQTTDYSVFKTIDSNRKIYPYHVNALVQSIENKNLLELNPIIVDKDMRIIDGQHRLEAARKLDLPIFFVIAGPEIEDGEDTMRLLNASSKRWSFADYIDSYSKKGLPSYLLIKQLTKDKGIPEMAAAEVLSDLGAGGGLTRHIRAGTFTANRSLKDASEMIDKLNVIRSYAVMSGKNRRPLVGAIKVLDKNSNVDWKRMAEKFAQASYTEGSEFFKPGYTVHDTLVGIEAVYNMDLALNSDKRLRFA